MNNKVLWIIWACGIGTIIDVMMRQHVVSEWQLKTALIISANTEKISIVSCLNIG